MTLTPPPDSSLNVYNLTELKVGDVFLLVNGSKGGKITESDVRTVFCINLKGIVTEKLDGKVKVIFFREKTATLVKSTDGHFCVRLCMEKIDFSFVR